MVLQNLLLSDNDEDSNNDNNNIVVAILSKGFIEDFYVFVSV